jgi:hypothetical protein
MSFRVAGVAGVAVVMSLLIAGCGDKPPRDASTYTTDNPYGTDPKYADPKDYNPRTQGGANESNLSLMSALFGNNQPTQGGGDGSGGGAIGVSVNSFLWRASLDTVSFMPLASADPFGGVIITDWYSPPETPSERFKVNVFILNRELRADGVRASVFHQRRDPAGNWVEAAVDANTGTDLENAILTRARQLRLSYAQK